MTDAAEADLGVQCGAQKNDLVDAHGTADVLHLLAPAPFGGLEQVVRMLAMEQHRAGAAVHVCAVLEPQEIDHPLVRGLRAAGVPVHEARRPRRRYLHERRLIRDVCQRLSPSVVHTHGYHPDVLHGPVARRLGLPTVTTVHGFTSGGWKNRGYEMLQRRSHRRFDAVVGVSRAMLSGLEAAGVASDKVHCVPNALAREIEFVERSEARARLGLPSEGFVAGFVGRLSQEKGPDVFLQAVARRAGASLTAIFVGDGTLRVQLERRAEERSLRNIVWAGMVPNAATLLRALDVLALSSRTEGLPIVLLEAMEAGVPIVATAVGGVSDVVTQREAHLVPPEDPERLADAITDVMNRPDEARRRAEAARERLRSEFGPEAWVARYQEVYHTCGGAASRATV